MEKWLNFIVVPGRYLIEITLYIILAIITFSWGNNLFSTVIGGNNPAISLESYSAFFGAFFAFVFVSISETAKKFHERQVKHYNSLCGLEDWLIQVGNIMHDNLYLMPEFRRVSVSGNVYTTFPKNIPQDRVHYLNLLELELANKILSLNNTIRRLNDDIQSIVEWYIELRRLYTAGNEPPNGYMTTTYIENCKVIAVNLKLEEAAMEMAQDEVVDVIASVRVRMKLDKPLSTLIQQYFSGIFRANLDNQMLKKAKADFLKELEESKNLSTPEIEQMKKRASKIKD